MTQSDKKRNTNPMDIDIIPEDALEHTYYRNRNGRFRHTKPSIKDILISVLILFIATGTGILFQSFEFSEANTITVYLLAVLLISVFTKSYLCNVVSSLLGVLLFNFFFTEPRFTFHAYEQEYFFTFSMMLIASIMTGTLAGKLKQHANQSSKAAYRTEILLNTNQLLHKANDENEIIRITSSQLLKLLNRNIIAFTELDGQLKQGYLFLVSNEPEEITNSFKEREIAEWVFQNQTCAGYGTNQFCSSPSVYHAILMNRKVYGVIGILLKGEPLDAFENSILLSILGECALAIENIRNVKEKEAAAVLAQKEQLRANLLRAISHDLRTPLTSISGNASNLISNAHCLDNDTMMQMFYDIYEDSQWLISLVENLLSITRLEEGRLNFTMKTELMDEVIDEALRHITRNKLEHHIHVTYQDEFLLAKMDARLILQVIINLVENAIKYTPAGSDIRITAGKRDDMIFVSIADNGAGIRDELKPKVFEMFFTGENPIADSRRSMGLGLALCKSIIDAHHGEITLTDHIPHGCVFTFTLPSKEAILFEKDSGFSGGR